MHKRESISSLGIDIGKLPPMSPELEEAVLGALIIDGDSIYEIADIITPEAFYKEEHQKICQAIITLFEESKKIDMLTISEKLRQQKQLEEVAGPVYIAGLTKRISNSRHIKDHYAIVFQKYIQREIIRITSNNQAIAFDESCDVQDMVDSFNRDMDILNDIMAGKKQASHISQVLKKSIESLRKREAAVKEGKLAGFKTPLLEMDKMIQGWQPNLYIIAARPSQGKSAFMLASAKTAALYGEPVCIYSLEMDDVKLTDRLIMSEADIPEYAMRSGKVTRENWVSINKAEEKLRKLPIYIDDNPAVNFTYIKSHSRVMKKKGLCNMILLDYLQLADMDMARNDNREREVSKFTRNMKKLQKQLNIPIVVLSQLNREVEKMGDKRPQLSNLRESGAIEQDADVVMFIHRPWVYGIKEDRNGNTWENNGLLIIAKQREGPLGDIRFSHNESITKIHDWADPNKFKPMISNRDKQLPPEKDDFNDIPDTQNDLPF